MLFRLTWTMLAELRTSSWGDWDHLQTPVFQCCRAQKWPVVEKSPAAQLMLPRKELEEAGRQLNRPVCLLRCSAMSGCPTSWKEKWRGHRLKSQHSA